MLPHCLKHPEAKVVATLALVLLASEAGMRLIEHRLSKDVAHLQSLSGIVDGLQPESAGNGLRVLFLGNSLTRYGVLPEEFRREAAIRPGEELRIVKMTPDNTAVADWSYAYRNFIRTAEHKPDLLVIGFEGDHLRDAPSKHTNRLGRYYCDWSDLPELCRYDLPTFEDRARYVAEANSALLSNRDRIERRVLDLVIPGYRDGIQELNNRRKTERRATAPPPTYERLRSLLADARQDGVTVVIAAMPVRTPYELDTALLATLDEGQARLIDCRDVPGIVPEMFPDGIHMNETAAVTYSRYLARQLTGPLTGSVAKRD